MRQLETVQRGSRGETVRILQARLGVQQSSVFGPTTEQVVREFQRQHGLTADGVAGPVTWAALLSVRHQALRLARKEIGVREEPPGSNRGPKIDAWNRLAGVPVGSFWCMSFVHAKVREAADELDVRSPMPVTASCSALYAWAERHGKLVSTPQPGDIFLVRGGVGGRTHQHTGFVAGPASANRFPTIEGNSNGGGSRNGIEVAARPSRSAIGCDFVRL
ncbi:MAG: peptidoglycan-binding protein [Armatimonadota bacterium]